MRDVTITRSTAVPATAETAWEHATSLAGIRSELPWPLRLTTRPVVATIAEFVAAGDVLAELRVVRVPVVRWHPGIVELGERHFVEASGDMTAMRSWRHERRVAPGDAGGCTVTDVVTFAPRVPGTARLVRWLFDRRHRALARQLA